MAVFNGVVMVGLSEKVKNPRSKAYKCTRAEKQPGQRPETATLKE